jgi:hypothetical protein
MQLLQEFSNTKSRSKLANKPFADLDMRSSEGRRVRDVAIGLLQRVDNVDEITIADAVACAKLKVRLEYAVSDPDTDPKSLAALMEITSRACAPFEPRAA